ncbi:thiamine pyrophosphate-dependent enzyme [Bacillus subtilis]|uniref:thiamine pyrophosphate-dependent enzyme n=1 Tax=Bacillus subtilis TaxID=1423 RepID=UPI00202A86F9|nr:thiamine pyrophosphate-dependent enzyme [Bacillus subtilis]
MQADIDHFYEPALELVGNIAETIKHLAHDSVQLSLCKEQVEFVTELQELLSDIEKAPERESHLSHPLDVIHTLRRLIPDDTKVTCDIGSHAIWMSRHFRVYEPNTFLVSNGMQTLGVALPWAIAASILNPDEKIVSVGFDPSF